MNDGLGGAVVSSYNGVMKTLEFDVIASVLCAGRWECDFVPSFYLAVTLHLLFKDVFCRPVAAGLIKT
jgi:hypothetical protein